MTQKRPKENPDGYEVLPRVWAASKENSCADLKILR